MSTPAVSRKSTRDDLNLFDGPRPEALADCIEGIVWEVELPEWKVSFVGGQAERILGYPTVRWNDPDFLRSHIHPEDRSCVSEFYERSGAGRCPPIQFRMIAFDGNPVWLRSIASVESDGAGKRILRGVVTETAASLQSVEDANERAFYSGQIKVLEMIAAGVPLAEVLAAILNLIELQSNGMLCSILLLGDDGLHVRHGAAPSLPPAYLQAIDGAPIGPKAGSCGTAMYRGQQVIVADILEDPLWEDYRQLATAFQLRACWSTPILSHEGRVLGSFAMYYHQPRHPTAQELRLTGFATHITGIAIEREVAEQALRRSEEKYRRIVDTAREGIWQVDGARNVVFVNRRLAGMLGYTVEQMIGTSASAYIAGESGAWSQERRESQHSGTAEQFDLRFRRKDGSELWGIVSTTPVLAEDGAFTGSLGMVTDITERKRAESELRRSHEQIRQMAGKLITAQEEERRRVARELHDDICQKVAIVAIAISRIKQQLAQPEHPATAELSTLQQRVFGLANDVRQLSHQLHPAMLEHAGLIAALQSLIDEYSRREEIGVKLTVPDSDSAIPKQVSVCIYRIVQESLRNVAKHSGAKSAEVQLSFENGGLLLVVRDDGRGFEQGAQRPRGLGLVNMEERVHLCQGSIVFHSKPGQGATLTVRIPVAG